MGQSWSELAPTAAGSAYDFSMPFGSQITAARSDTVTNADVIGLVGTTGTAVLHLHFEVFEGQGEGTRW